MPTYTIHKTCSVCGRWFESRGQNLAHPREKCYKCLPSRVTRRSTYRGCPVCNSVFDINPEQPDIKTCPKCREARAKKRNNRLI